MGSVEAFSLKIWLVNPHAVPPSEGGGTRHFSIAKELNRRGHKTVVIASDAHYLGNSTERRTGLVEHDGVPFYYIPAPPYHPHSKKRFINHLVFASRLKRASIPGYEPDVIMGSNPHLWAADGARARAQSLGVPFVLELRDLWPEALLTYSQFTESHPIIRWMRRLERRLYAAAQQVVVTPTRAADYLVGHGVDRARVHAIPHGIDLDLVPAATSAPVNDSFTVMYAGAHGVANALDTVLEAAKELANEGVLFRLVGSGPVKATLIQRADSEGIHNVEFVDPVSKKDLFPLLQTADAFTMVTLPKALYKWGNSFNKMFDYMAMARPTIYAGSLPDCPVAEADGGLVIEPTAISLAQAVRDLMTMPLSEREAMGQRARRYVESHHSTATLASRFEEVFELACRGTI